MTTQMIERVIISLIIATFAGATVLIFGATETQFWTVMRIFFIANLVINFLREIMFDGRS